MFACYCAKADGFTDVSEGTTAIPCVEGSFISDEENIEVAILVKVEKSCAIAYCFKNSQR